MIITVKKTTIENPNGVRENDHEVTLKAEYEEDTKEYLDRVKGWLDDHKITFKDFLMYQWRYGDPSGDIILKIPAGIKVD